MSPFGKFQFGRALALLALLCDNIATVMTNLLAHLPEMNNVRVVEGGVCQDLREEIHLRFMNRPQ